METISHIKQLCKSMTADGNALESYLQWHHRRYNDELTRPNYSYELERHNMSQTRRAVEYIYCTQIASMRLVTNPITTCYPDVISEEYYDQWCSDLFGSRYAAVHSAAIEWANRNSSFPFLLQVQCHTTESFRCQLQYTTWCRTSVREQCYLLKW